MARPHRTPWTLFHARAATRLLDKMVRLRVIIYPNCDPEISWAGGEGLLFSGQESVLEYGKGTWQLS
jgi:hypothetical protein